MPSVSQFLALGDPDFEPQPTQQEWHFTLPNDLDTNMAAVVFFRINTHESPRLAVLLNQTPILDRQFPKGTILSFHNRIPKGLLFVGQGNILLFSSELNADGNRPPINIGHPVVFYHVRIP